VNMRFINVRSACVSATIIALFAVTSLRAQTALSAPSEVLATKIDEQPAADLLPSVASTTELSVFHLHAASSTEIQLKAWAKGAGWTVVWNTPDDWIVPVDHTFTTDFQEAAQAVLTALAENGADIRVDVYPDDRSVVVRQAGTE
jgi:sarcosine oxidase gamma subunit